MFCIDNMTQKIIDDAKFKGFANIILYLFHFQYRNTPGLHGTVCPWKVNDITRNYIPNMNLKQT